jgi:hypothetical protein
MKRTTSSLRAALISTACFFGTFIQFAISQSPVGNTLFGYNAWAPYQINNNPIGGHFYHIQVNNWTRLDNTVPAGLGARTVRFGGSDYDVNWYSLFDVDLFINNCIGNGTEPIVQIPVLAGVQDEWVLNSSLSVSDCIDNMCDPTKAYKQKVLNIVNYVVNTFGTGVVMWSIGNEPDLWWSVHANVNGGSISNPNLIDLKHSNNGHDEISQYVKTVSDWIKTIDPSARIFGPDLAWHHQASPNNPDLLEELTSATSNFNVMATSVITNRPYVDVWSYHSYPFGSAKPNWSHQDVCNEAVNLNSRFSQVRAWLQNSSSNQATCKVAMTEVNVTNVNDIANGVYDKSCSSFIAGQFLAELLGYGLLQQGYLTSNLNKYSFPVASIIPWSVQESSGDGSTYDLGLFHRDNSSAHPGYVGRSTYHHLRMMCKEFQAGRPAIGTISQANSNVKIIAVRSCTGAAIMVMNQNQSGPAKSFAINFYDEFPTGTEDVQAKVDMEWTDRKLYSSDATTYGSIGPLQTHLYVLNAFGQMVRSYFFDSNISAKIFDDSKNYDDSKPLFNTFPNEAICFNAGHDWYDEWPGGGDPQGRIASTVTGISNGEVNSKITCLPNPSDEWITITGDAEFSFLELYNMNGEIMQTESFPTTTSYSVNLGRVPPGLYICTVGTSHGAPFKSIRVAKTN